MTTTTDTTVRSKISNRVPGLTKGKAYKFLRWGFWQGAYFEIVNDRGETIAIYDPEKYLHTEDIKGRTKGKSKKTK